MDTVLLLISSRHGPGIDDDTVATVARRLERSGPPVRKAAHVVEFDICAKAGSIEETVRAELGGQPIDVAVIAHANRTKKLLVADMDSTFIHQECIDEMGLIAGVGKKISAITERAMSGELDFETGLRERVALMKGLSISAIETIKNERITFTDGGRELVQAMRSNSAYTVLVSGGFTQFAAYVAKTCGFHESRANRLLIENGELTGKASEPVLGRDAKVSTLRKLCERLNISTEDAIAVGDGANDLGMLTAAGLGVGFHAKPTVREKADVRIDHAGLDALLWLQDLEP